MNKAILRNVIRKSIYVYNAKNAANISAALYGVLII